MPTETKTIKISSPSSQRLQTLRKCLVEDKLNDLLDVNGGICKRKDASRGYRKLLRLTVASGDNGNVNTIQSNRDLSIILDALLKTKSRGVLLDIINKKACRCCRK